MDRPWLQHYDPGVPEHIAYGDAPIDAILAARAARAPGRAFCTFKGARLTYGRMDALVDRMAAALQQRGLRAGDRVALHLPNCPQFPIAFNGVLRAGGIVVPCNPTYVPREMAHQLGDAGAKMVITLSSTYDTIRAVRDRTAVEVVLVARIKTYFPWHLRTLFTVFLERRTGHALDLSGEPDALWLAEALRAAPPKPSPVDRDPDAIAVLMYTGGTTGVSKGAQLTQRNLVVNAAQCAHWLKTTDRGAILLTALPLFHSYAMTTCMNHAVYVGGSMNLVPDPRDMKDVLKTIQRERPTIYPGVPAMYVAINNDPDVAASKYDLGSIESCISGAAALSAEVQATFQALTGARLVEGYGLSEASPVTHINPIENGDQVGYIGLPVADTDARIVDLETGTRVLGPGEVGELCVRGPQVMKGYWNMPGETAEALRGGWLYTGDIATMTEEGYFRLVDRKKDMIVGAGGYNVYPTEIEDVLYRHPKVREAVAAGVPVGDKGERVKVWIVPKDGEQLSEDEVLAFCAENLAPYKRPRYVEFRQDLPKTLIGKMLRRVLVAEEASRAVE
ncbi:MAG: long-chain fatty acid--CoA ligase [Anaerolineae bacterium]|nr:long-chain fatty acid--CoA ligase [Anaerolineae bacterium]